MARYGKVWLIVGLILTIGYVCIIIYNNRSQEVKRFYVYSHDVTTSAMAAVVAEALPLQYSSQYSYHTPGRIGVRNFTIRRDYLLELGLPVTNFLSLDKTTVRNIMLVTGASSNHFREVLDVVAGAQKYFPQYQIVFIDYGLTYEQSFQAKTWCGVTVVKFDFSRYPPHVRNMWYYAWKVLTIMEMLKLHPNSGILWLDASVRFKHGDINWAFEQAIENGGMVHLSDPALTLFSLTHPQLYEYFPTDLREAKGLPMVQAGAILVYNTRVIYHAVLYWAYLCALQKECIAPTDELICNFKGKDFHKEWVGCHRYDQSLFNLLEGNFHNFDTSRYDGFQRNVTVEILREATSFHVLQFCNKSELPDLKTFRDSFHWFGNPILTF